MQDLNLHDHIIAHAGYSKNPEFTSIAIRYPKSSLHGTIYRVIHVQITFFGGHNSLRESIVISISLRIADKQLHGKHSQKYRNYNLFNLQMVCIILE